MSPKATANEGARMLEVQSGGERAAVVQVELGRVPALVEQHGHGHVRPAVAVHVGDVQMPVVLEVGRLPVGCEVIGAVAAVVVDDQPLAADVVAVGHHQVQPAVAVDVDQRPSGAVGAVAGGPVGRGVVDVLGGGRGHEEAHEQKRSSTRHVFSLRKRYGAPARPQGSVAQTACPCCIDG